MSTELKPQPRAKLTQAERLLRHARQGYPLNQNDWWDDPPDGGSPIKALRSRVAELESRGYVFRHVCRRGRLTEYWLVQEPGAQREGAAPIAPALPEDDGAERLALEQAAAHGSGLPATSPYSSGNEYA